MSYACRHRGQIQTRVRHRLWDSPDEVIVEKAKSHSAQHYCDDGAGRSHARISYAALEVGRLTNGRRIELSCTPNTHGCWRFRYMNRR